MRIGVVTGEYPPMQGGVGDFTRELCKALAALGQEVHILTRVGSESKGLPANCHLHPGVERWDWSTSGRLRRWIQTHDLEIVNLQYQAAAYEMHPAVNLLSSRAAGVPLVVTFHDLNVPYLFPKAGRIRWWAVLALARRASGVIVTNREDQLILERYRAIARLAAIPIGSNISPSPPPSYDRDAWRRRWGVRSDETLLGYFGFLNESKGSKDLIRTCEILKGSPVKLMMIGGRTGSSDPSNQYYAKEIDDLIAELGLEEQIFWTGYCPSSEVSAGLLAADILLLPYRDGVSYRRGSFMAAVAHGRPIISTTPRVELESLRHQENIYLVPPAAPVAMAEAVRTLRKNDMLCKKLAAGSAELARSFRWDSIAQATLALFESTR